VRIILLFAVAAVFYGLGLWAHLRSVRHLVRGVTPKEVAWNPTFRDDEGARGRLASLYTARGWRLRRLGMVFGGFCALAIVVALFDLLF